MEIGEQHVDGLEPIARRDEDRRVAGKRADGAVAVVAADSRMRRVVVPAATMRRPARARRVQRLRRRRADLAPFRMHLVIAVSVALTGRNVPAPTCSVTFSIATPRAASAATSAGVKCRPAVGAATAPGSRANKV